MTQFERIETSNRMSRMLSKECILIYVQKSRWGGTKADKASSGILAADAGGDADGWSNASFKLIPQGMRKDYDKAYNNIGTAIQSRGMPMLSGYVIRVADYNEVRKSTDEEVATFIKAADDLAMRHSTIVDAVRANIKERFDDGMIPPSYAIRQMAWAKINTVPIGVAPEGMESINEALESAYHDAITNQLNIIKDLVNETKAIIDDTLNGDKKSFKSTRWTSIKDELGKLRQLNIDNQKIDDACNVIDKLVDVVSLFKSSDIKADEETADMIKTTTSTMVDLLGGL